MNELQCIYTTLNEYYIVNFIRNKKNLFIRVWLTKYLFGCIIKPNNDGNIRPLLRSKYRTDDMLGNIHRA